MALMDFETSETKLLLFETFCHYEKYPNVDFIKFDEPVIVDEIRVLPLGYMIETLLPGKYRVGATLPSNIDLRFFANNVQEDNLKTSTFSPLAKLNYNTENFCIRSDQVVSDGLIVQGKYNCLSLAIIGRTVIGIRKSPTIFKNERDIILAYYMIDHNLNKKIMGDDIGLLNKDKIHLLTFIDPSLELKSNSLLSLYTSVGKLKANQIIDRLNRLSENENIFANDKRKIEKELESLLYDIHLSSNDFINFEKKLLMLLDKIDTKTLSETENIVVFQPLYDFLFKMLQSNTISDPKRLYNIFCHLIWRSNAVNQIILKGFNNIINFFDNDCMKNDSKDIIKALIIQLILFSSHKYDENVSNYPLIYTEFLMKLLNYIKEFVYKTNKTLDDSDYLLGLIKAINFLEYLTQFKATYTNIPSTLNENFKHDFMESLNVLENYFKTASFFIDLDTYLIQTDDQPFPSILITLLKYTNFWFIIRSIIDHWVLTDENGIKSSDTNLSIENLLETILRIIKNVFTFNGASLMVLYYDRPIFISILKACLDKVIRHTYITHLEVEFLIFKRLLTVIRAFDLLLYFITPNGITSSDHDKICKIMKNIEESLRPIYCGDKLDEADNKSKQFYDYLEKLLFETPQGLETFQTIVMLMVCPILPQNTTDSFVARISNQKSTVGKIVSDDLMDMDIDEKDGLLLDSNKRGACEETFLPMICEHATTIIQHVFVNVLSHCKHNIPKFWEPFDYENINYAKNFNLILQRCPSITEIGRDTQTHVKVTHDLLSLLLEKEGNIILDDKYLLLIIKSLSYLFESDSIKNLPLDNYMEISVSLYKISHLKMYPKTNQEHQKTTDCQIQMSKYKCMIWHSICRYISTHCEDDNKIRRFITYTFDLIGSFANIKESCDQLIQSLVCFTHRKVNQLQPPIFEILIDTFFEYINSIGEKSIDIGEIKLKNNLETFTRLLPQTMLKCDFPYKEILENCKGKSIHLQSIIHDSKNILSETILSNHNYKNFVENLVNVAFNIDNLQHSIIKLFDTLCAMDEKATSTILYIYQNILNDTLITRKSALFTKIIAFGKTIKHFTLYMFHLSSHKYFPTSVVTLGQSLLEFLITNDPACPEIVKTLFTTDEKNVNLPIQSMADCYLRMLSWTIRSKIQSSTIPYPEKNVILQNLWSTFLRYISINDLTFALTLRLFETEEDKIIFYEMVECLETLLDHFKKNDKIALYQTFTILKTYICFVNTLLYGRKILSLPYSSHVSEKQIVKLPLQTFKSENCFKWGLPGLRHPLVSIKILLLELSTEPSTSPIILELLENLNNIIAQLNTEQVVNNKSIEDDQGIEKLLSNYIVMDLQEYINNIMYDN